MQLASGMSLSQLLGQEAGRQLPGGSGSMQSYGPTWLLEGSPPGRDKPFVTTSKNLTRAILKGKAAAAGGFHLVHSALLPACLDAEKFDLPDRKVDVFEKRSLKSIGLRSLGSTANPLARYLASLITPTP